MQRKRRSGRIAKELSIFLLGTDTAGKVFSEETKTVVLSRYGAGVLSRYRFAPDEVLTLRLPGSTKEAEIRLVGQIGGEPGRYVYGVAFVDPAPQFWAMEFPPGESYESAADFVTLECSLCRARQNVEQHDIEEDVYSINGNVLRYCEGCGTSTPWRKAQVEAAPALVANSQKASFDAPAASVAAPSELAHSASRPAILLSQASSYSGASAIPEFSSLSDMQASSAATAVLTPPELETAVSAKQFLGAAAKPAETPAPVLDASGRRVNRRRHMRIRVNFSACVRHAAHGDEIVECENVSKGGLCFHSRRQYSVESLIEVAAPFSPGEPALFVPAQIKRVVEFPGGEVFRYGAAYVKPAPAKPSL